MIPPLPYSSPATTRRSPSARWCATQELLAGCDHLRVRHNSTDRTAEIAEAEGAIVRREPRQGKGNVIRAMFEDIDADVYVMADGDDTYPADAAPAMVAKVLEGYDMVIGDRLSSTYFQENKRPFHNFGNRLVRGSINGLFGAHVTDIMTGYRAFNFTFVKTYPRAFRAASRSRPR